MVVYVLMLLYRHARPRHQVSALVVLLMLRTLQAYSGTTGSRLL